MNDPQLITVSSRNYDGSLRRSWTARLIRKEKALIEMVGEFDFDVDHPDLGIIRRGTVSHEYYWLDRWYNVFRFHDASGQFRNFYCNINLPPIFQDFALDYVDLDIDLLVDSSGSITVLDEAEFEENVKLFKIPADVCDNAKRAVDQLALSIERRIFPFDRHLN